MPCHTCVHYLEDYRDPDVGLCRLKSDSVGFPFEMPAESLCEFFDLDASKLDDVQMVICRHCGEVAIVAGEVELCDDCVPEFNLVQFFKDEGLDPRSSIKFNCSRTYRDRWLKRRLVVKQGGKGA